MKDVPLIGRVLDAVGLLIFTVGGGLVGWAWVGFREVPDYTPPPDAGAFASIAFADGFWRLQKIGGALMIVGVAVFVFAWWTARRVAAGRPEARL